MTQPVRCDSPVPSDYAQLYEILISELTDFAVFLTDPTGCVVSWNPGVERLLGYDEADWLGRPAEVIFTPDDRADGVPGKEMAKAISEGRAPDIRWHQRKDGSRLFVEGTMVALKDGYGKLLGFSKVMRDITERKQAETALRASEERFRALLIASSDAVYHMSPDWTQMRHLGGGGFLPDMENPSEDWLHEYIYPEDQPGVLEAVQEATQSQSLFELEHRVRRSDGTEGWTFSRAVPVCGESGEITEWFGAASDITARKTAEAERERLMAELARSNEDLSQFARVASHDLRAPLNTITRFSQLLLKRYRGKVLDENAEDCLKILISNSQRMAGLTSDLLRYAEVSASPFLAATPIRAGSMLEVALAHLEGDIEESGAVVTCDALPEVKLDGTILAQLFQNLIDNSLKYRGKDVPRIHIRGEEDGSSYRFSVKDNGVGIEERYLKSIFEPFKRLHGADVSGSGIGLTVCKKIVERAGGRIWAESEGRQGATFLFTLPR